MNNILYYPYIDIKNETWLKFALLYFNRIEMIIPPVSEFSYSETSYLIRTETDLIHDYITDDYSILYMAGKEAVNQLENIFRNDRLCYRLFGMDARSLFQEWDVTNSKSPEVHTFCVYHDKVENVFFDYICYDCRLGYKDNEGLKVPEKIGLFYLSILAHTIGEANNKTCITDAPHVNSLALKMREINRKDMFLDNHDTYELIEKVKLAQNIINLKVPSNIREIDLHDIIKYRNKRKQRIEAFHKEIDHFYNSVGIRNNPENFIDYLDQSIKDFTMEMCAIGSTAISVGLGVWFALNSANTETLSYVKEGMAISSLGPTLLVNKRWKNIKNTQITKKMLVDLSKLK